MESIIQKKLANILKVIKSLEAIKGVILESFLDEDDKNNFIDLLRKSYNKRDDFKRNIEELIDEKFIRKKVKFP